jgi:very-short-patch-repair endonuclease
MHNPNNPKLIKYARKNRKIQTPSETKLWKYLRGKQMFGYKFRRQHPILNYILDFYCMELRLAIEIDGGSHDERKYEYDVKRQKELEGIGMKFLRFSENEVKTRLEEVMQSIELKVEEIRNDY